MARVSECQRYIFVEAATELIASSMVAAKGCLAEAFAKQFGIGPKIGECDG